MLALETPDGRRVPRDAALATFLGSAERVVARVVFVVAPSADPTTAVVTTRGAAPLECHGDALEHAYAIVLRRDAARLRHTAAHTRARLPEVTLVDAVDGTTPALRDFLQTHRVSLAPQWARECTVGQYACDASRQERFRIPLVFESG